MLYFAVKLLSRLACSLSAATAKRWGGYLGSAAWRLTPQKRKKLAMENIRLSLAVDQAEAERVAHIHKVDVSKSSSGTIF